MSTTVTVKGASGETLSVSYDSGVGGNSNLAAGYRRCDRGGCYWWESADRGNRWRNAASARCHLVRRASWHRISPRTTVIPQGYDQVVVSDDAASANLIGNGDPGRNFGRFGEPGFRGFRGAGGFRFSQRRRDNVITLPSSDAGSWLLSLGDGNNQVRALGAGADTISTGTGNNTIQVGTGPTQITTAGNDTITAAGNDTIHASGTDVVHGGPTLYFVGGLGSTVYGGSGSDTIIGGSGPDLFYGGTGGNNSITAGTGNATLFGGGDGDQLFASGAGAPGLYAGPGRETLSGAQASAGGHDTFAAGPGNDLIIGGAGANTYVASLGNTTIQAATTPGATNVSNSSGAPRAARWWNRT